MNRERHLRTPSPITPLLLVALFAGIGAQPTQAQGQSQSATGETSADQPTVLRGPDDHPMMRRLPSGIARKLKDDEGIEDILINKVVSRNDNGSLKMRGFTTPERDKDSDYIELETGEVLEFTVEGEADQNADVVTITVKIEKDLIPLDDGQRLQTQDMSIGFKVGTNTCWQECWKEGGQKICERVCYD